MNPKGVSLTDVWTDIPPVRHAKYKKRKENCLPLKLMDRIIAIASDPGSVVLDPFGGSGTTYAAAELTGRRWVGSELDCSAIIDRFNALEGDSMHLAAIHADKNTLFTETTLGQRRKIGKPISKDYQVPENQSAAVDVCDCSLPLFAANDLLNIT